MHSVASGILEGIGQVTQNLIESIRFILARRVNKKDVMAQTAAIGFDSVPIALIINLVAGCVLSLNTAEKFALTGADAYVGALVALAMIREMAPIFTAFAVGARAGTAISAEIANMSVTNQLDAFQMMHVNPVRYLMVPRVIALVISMPLITILSELIGTLGGMVTAYASVGQHFSVYLDSIQQSVKWYDIEVSLIKALVFGILIAGISVTIGLNTKGGARNVGLATTQATVWTAITSIIADFFLTWIFFGTSYSN